MIAPPEGNDEKQIPGMDREPQQPTNHTSIHSTAPSGYTMRQGKFVKLAKTLFKFFLPLESRSALVAKYWGAVYVLIEVKFFHLPLVLMPISIHNYQDESKLYQTLSSFPRSKLLLELLAAITSDWTRGKVPQPWHLKTPDVFGEAWLHPVMVFVLMVDNRNDEAYKESEACRLAVSKGREETIKRLAPDSLHTREAVLPLGITSLVIKNLVDRGVPGQPDISSTYLEFLDLLVR